MQKAIVITPTIGSNIPALIQNIKSIRTQTIPVYHLLVVDGFEHYQKIHEAFAVNEDFNDVGVAMVPFNTGGNGFYGHRIMAAYAHLHDFQYTLYLDEDNWYEPEHVESLVATIEKFNYKFAYSFRNICRNDGTFACVDECESLGLEPSVDEYHLVDTSSYCFKTDFLIKVSQLWHKGWGADREFFKTIMAMESMKGKFGPSGYHSLNYRLGGNPNSVKEDFFVEGNLRKTKKGLIII